MDVLVVPWRVVGDGRAWTSLLFLASRMPLGLAYFLVPAGLGAAAVVLTPVAGLGVPILLLALGVAVALVSFERRLGQWWLGVDVTVAGAATLAPGGGASRWARVRAFVVDPMTWRGLAYLLLQLPLGLLAFVLFAGAAAAALAMMASPLAYLVLVVAVRPADFGVPAMGARLGMAIGGALLAVAALHAARLAGRAYGMLIQLLLGMGRADVELARARREAAAATARAEDEERKRRELIMSMSHELRTPAASIRGHAEALLDPERPLSDGERRRYLEVLAREAARVGALTDDLLSIARADAGGISLDIGAVDVAELVDHVRAAMEPIARRDREIALTAGVAPDLPPARADRERLEQVLMNLVRNAITYTPDGGIVSIRATTAGDDVALTVEDTGIGIAAEELARVFDRFYRADESRSRRTGGFGLGLAISRELVEAMGGRIEAESRPGRGSRFTVLLPRAG